MVTSEMPAPVRDDDLILSVRGLKTYYPGPHKGLWPWSGRLTVKAVDDVSLDIRRGQTLGLVGESGCGKTTVGRSLLQLVRPTAGEVFFEGQDLRKLKDDELYPLRRRMQIIFQDPYASLDPRCTVGFTISEGLLIHKLVTQAELRDRVADLMATVGLNPAFENRYPHEFSGGQRQRVGIAGRSPPTRLLSSATSPFPRSTSPSRRRSSTCCGPCAISST